jgi:hypothetical protein
LKFGPVYNAVPNDALQIWLEYKQFGGGSKSPHFEHSKPEKDKQHD